MIKTYHFSPNTPVLRDIAINTQRVVALDSAQSLPCIVFCASVLESFKILVEVRNAIVHNKPEVMVTDGAASKPNIDLKSYPKFIRQLKSKRIISEVDGTTSWIDLLQSEEVAAWSVKTMNDMIQLFMSALDDGEYKECFTLYY